MHIGERMRDMMVSEAVVSGTDKVRGFSKFFILSAGIILAITGIAKVWSGLGTAKLLAVADPVTGIPFGRLMLTVGVAELVIAIVCFCTKRNKLALNLITWLATNFLFYRVGLWWIGWRGACSCLGNLTDALHVSPQSGDNAMKIILGYLLLGSYFALFFLGNNSTRDIHKTKALPNHEL